jgi:hypothetical protein
MAHEEGLHTSFDRVHRSPQKQGYMNMPMTGEEVVEYTTVKEFFGMPHNPIPMINDKKKLVYRDGTRDKSGKLPRATQYYPTGYE